MVVTATPNRNRIRQLCESMGTIVLAELDIATAANNEITPAVRTRVFNSALWPEFIKYVELGEIGETWLNGKTIGRMVWLWAKKELAVQD